MNPVEIQMRSIERQLNRKDAIEFASALQLLEGLGLTIAEELKRGRDIHPELQDSFRRSQNVLSELFEKLMETIESDSEKATDTP